MKITNALKGVITLGLDTAPFIYLIENDTIYGPRMAEVIRVAATRRMTLVTTVLTLTEVITQPIRLGDTALANSYRNYLLNSGPRLIVAPVDVAIAERAAELRAKYNLKTPDAIQAATAIESGCDAFLHNDAQLLRVTEINSLLLKNLTT